MFEHRHPYGTLITIAVVLGMAFWFAGGSRVKDLAPYYFDRIIGRTATVEIRGVAKKVEVARSEHAQQKGLSGRDYLAPNRGMLFVFSQLGVYQFTMAKTKIPLDIVWLAEGKIVQIVSNAVPGQPLISPTVQADHVLEVRSGSSGSGSWQVGDSVTIEYDQPIIHF